MDQNHSSQQHHPSPDDFVRNPQKSPRNSNYQQKYNHQNALTYLENVKKLNKIKTRLNYLEVLQSETLSNISRNYRELGNAEGKIRWRDEFEESTNPEDLKFFLNEQPEKFFDPSQFKQIDSCLAEIREKQESLAKIEKEQMELKLKQKEIMPNSVYQDPKTKLKN